MQLKVNCSSCTPLALRFCNPCKTTVTTPSQANISWKQLILQCKENHKWQSFIFRFEIKVKNRGNYLNDHPTVSLSSSATAKRRRIKCSFCSQSVSELLISPVRIGDKMKYWTTSITGTVNHNCSSGWTHLPCFSAKPARSETIRKRKKEKYSCMRLLNCHLPHE